MKFEPLDFIARLLLAYSLLLECTHKWLVVNSVEPVVAELCWNSNNIGDCLGRGDDGNND